MKVKKIVYSLLLLLAICSMVSCKPKCKHSTKTWITDKEATCEEDGIKYEECDDCHQKFSSKFIPMLGHNFENGKCIRCGYNKVNDILEYTLNEENTGYIVNGISDKNITDLIIPTSYNDLPVYEISDYAFQSCSNLKKVKITGISTIGDFAFSYCENLEEVILSNEMAYIGTNAFAGCESLKSIRLPEDLIVISSRCFLGCSSLESIDLPKGLEKIEMEAFVGCTSLAKLVIPYNVQFIEENVFNDCTNLKIFCYGHESDINTKGDWNGSATIVWNFEGCFHDKFEWNVVSDPTCENYGTKIKVCLDCSKSFGEEEFIDPLGHNYNWVIDKEATETETGLKHEECDNCHDKKSKNTVIEKLAHVHEVQHVPAKDKTCKTEGNKEYYFCTKCERYFIDSECTIAIDREELIIRSGHNKVHHEGLAPTCEEPGYFPYDTCENCDYTTYEEKPALGHNYKHGKCLNCGDINTPLIYRLNSDGTGYIVSGISDKECEDIIIPDEYNGLPVLEIGNSAFLNCTSAKTLVLPRNLTTIGVMAFCICTNIRSIELPDTVTTIKEYAFNNCRSITSFIIPEGVTSIEEKTFYYCDSLKSIVIPKNISKIGEMAFSRCNALTSLTVDKDNKVFDSRENCNAIIETATNTLVAGCKTTLIPSSVQVIGSGSFWYLESLNNIVIPNGVTTIKSLAFDSCTSLQKVEIADSVTSIEGAAFSNCFYLKNIVLPNGLTEIVGSLFYGCKNLTTVQLPTNLTSIGGSAFKLCKSLTSIEIPSTVTNIGECAFEGCEALGSVKIPSGVTTIQSGTFNSCLTLESVEIPDTVTTIESYAFYKCGNLRNVVIPDSVTTIESHVFENCTQLKTIKLSNNLTTLGKNAFKNCINLTSIVIPSSVQKMESSVFEGCEGIIIYCEAEQKPYDWDNEWNSNNKVVWGYKNN